MGERLWRIPWGVFLLALAVTAAVYLPGLRGPLLLDDFDNLQPITSFLAGERSASAVIFGNESGPLRRPVAMATFVVDAMLFGHSVWHAKRTNLIIHLLCGLAMFAVFRRMLTYDPVLAQRLAWLPALLAGAWLLLPINVSTVLYLVQRMAMLSALFVLVGLWVFLWSRERIDTTRPGGLIGLWLGVPACTILAMLSKENGALLPLLALALELSLLRNANGKSTPWSVRAFFAAAVALPALLMVLLLLLRPESLLAGYAIRDFTVGERVLTQFRVLWDYVFTVLVPYSPKLGLYHDHYTRSGGLFSPWTTAAAILAWVGVLGVAWRFRSAAPSVFAGLLLFLCAHAMESSIFPLEIYFEHRNYLPSFGLLVAVAGAAFLVVDWLPTPSKAFRRAAPLLVLMVPVAYALTTLGRAQVWSSEGLIMAQELRYNSESPRMRMTLGTYAIRAGLLDEALEHIQVAERNLPERQAATIALWRLAAYCGAKQAPPALLFDRLAERAQGRVEFYARVGLNFLGLKIEEGDCGDFDVERLVGIVAHWLSDPELDSRHPDVWGSRFRLGRLLLYLEHFEEADEWVHRAWNDSGRRPGLGVLAFRLAATVGDVGRCEEVLSSLEDHYGKGDNRLDGAIESFRQALLDGQIGAD